MSDSVAARAEGKSRIRSATVWTFECGSLKARCVLRNGEFVFEGKVGFDRYRLIGKGATPVELLERFVSSTNTRSAISSVAGHAKGTR